MKKKGFCAILPYISHKNVRKMWERISMKFIRLNKDTVRCILSSDDMKEYGVEIKDFMEQNEHAMEFMHRLIEKASEEVGYVAKNGMITMRVMQMPGDKLSITISEASPEELASGDFVDKMETLFRKLSEMEQIKNELENGNAENVTGETYVQTVFKNKEITVFSFQNLDEISEYAKSIQYGRAIQSDLYKKGESYILVIKKGSMAEVSYAKICFRAFDFGGKLIEEKVASSLEEHGDSLIKKKALTIMKKL